MFNNLKKTIAQNKIGAVLGALVLGAVQSQAALTFDMSSAETDVTSAVVAIIGLLVLIFGFRKVMGLLGR
jgi:microcompartment protein CcmK/EutM